MILLLTASEVKRFKSIMPRKVSDCFRIHNEMGRKEDNDDDDNNDNNNNSNNNN
jgi:hypothetical protein